MKGSDRAVEDAENRLRERRIMLIMWISVVVLVSMLGIGFAGGLREAYFDNPIGWAFSASPIIPMALWLRARREYRAACMRGRPRP